MILAVCAVSVGTVVGVASMVVVGTVSKLLSVDIDNTVDWNK